MASEAADAAASAAAAAESRIYVDTRAAEARVFQNRLVSGTSRGESREAA
jgi:trimeric autotransporter adhesin